MRRRKTLGLAYLEKGDYEQAVKQLSEVRALRAAIRRFCLRWARR